MNKIALITGATAGFGEATAKLFAQNGFNIIITGRRAERLEKLKATLEKEHHIFVLSLCFDVRNRSEVESALTNIPEAFNAIDVLVNNAGLASGFSHVQEADIDDWERMIDTNVKGLLYVSRALIPGMIERKSGHIINIGSTAGKEVYERGNVYCASKHAVDAITKGMRIDLLGTGIKVTQIAPGAAETEFSEVRFHGDKEKAKNVYNGYKPMEAEDIASLVYYATTLPPHLCINDLVVTSISQANSFYINRKS
jgi:3-hydroxy acid dehydrogenase / malonic semialdehyde reductase